MPAPDEQPVATAMHTELKKIGLNSAFNIVDSLSGGVVLSEDKQDKCQRRETRKQLIYNNILL